MPTAKLMSREIRKEFLLKLTAGRTLWFFSVLLCALCGESSLAPIHLPILHDKLHVPQRLDVLQRIAGHRDDVRESARCDYADLAFPLEHHRCTRGCALDSIHRLHA